MWKNDYAKAVFTENTPLDENVDKIRAAAEEINLKNESVIEDNTEGQKN